MAKRNVFAFSDLPISYSRVFSGSALLWLLLDRLQIGGWLAGAIWTLWGILCVAVVVASFTQNQVKFFKEK